MTTTRTLFPRYKAILTALEGGPLLARDLVAQGIFKSGDVLPNMLASGFIEREKVPDGGRRKWQFSVTDEGRAVLDSGEMACKVPGKNWNAGTPRRAKVVLDPARCVHYWKIENDLQQSATCATCGATREFRQPFPWEKKSALTRATIALRDREDDEVRFDITQAEETLSRTAEAGI